MIEVQPRRVFIVKLHIKTEGSHADQDHYL